MPIPRSHLDGRYLTAVEFEMVRASAKVSPGQLRNWQRRHACLNPAVEKRIDAAVDEIVNGRGDAKLEGGDDGT